MKVSTVNLSPDLTTAGPAYGTIDRGERSSEGLTTLLQEFLLLDPTLAFMHDPQVIVQTRQATYAIRTDRGRLHLYNARDTSQPGAEMDLTALLAVLDDSIAPASVATEPELLTPLRAPWKHHGLLASALMMIGLGLNGWGAYQFLQRKPIAPERAFVTISDEAATSMLRQKLAGTYVTGNEPGSRVIVLRRDGTIRFDLLVRHSDGTVRPAVGASEECRFGRRTNGAVCLVTTRSGQIAIGKDGSLAQFGDTYRRIAALAH